MIRLTTFLICITMLCGCKTVGYGIALMESISDDLSGVHTPITNTKSGK